MVNLSGNLLRSRLSVVIRCLRFVQDNLIIHEILSFIHGIILALKSLDLSDPANTRERRKKKK